MFGFFFGAACLFGVFAYHRHRRRMGFCRHRGDHHLAHHGGAWHGHGGRGWGRRWNMRGRSMERMVGWLATRLEATPEQYRVMRNEVEQFGDKAQNLKREFRLSRDDIAAAMQGESFDAEVMGDSFARQDDRIREVREQLVGALARIHDVLDERQRRRLGDLMNHFDGRPPHAVEY